MTVYPVWGACHCGLGYSFPRVIQRERLYELWWKCFNGHYRYQVIDLKGET